jgi:hypothetical protein
MLSREQVSKTYNCDEVEEKQSKRGYTNKTIWKIKVENISII